jgi:hypothetical protein
MLFLFKYSTETYKCKFGTAGEGDMRRYAINIIHS